MGGRDLNDRHQAGQLDVDTATEPLELGEIPLEDAEDLWLTVIALTPARAQFSRVQREHLSDRGKVILEIIRAHSNEGAGWPQVAPEHLTSEHANQIRLRWWATVKRQPAQELDLRSIPARLRHFAPGDMPLELAEETLIRSWTKAKTVILHKHVAGLAERDGVEAADAFYTKTKQRMAALTAGVKWRSFGELAKEHLAGLRAALETPESSRQLIGTGFPAIDAMVKGWKREMFTVVAGNNSHGKSTLIAQLLSQMAMGDGGTETQGFYLSGEDAMKVTISRIINWYVEDLRVAKRLAVGVPELGRNGGYCIGDVYDVDRLVRRLEKMPLYLQPMAGASLSQITAAIVDGARAGAGIGAHDYISTIPKPGSYETQDWRNHCLRTVKDAFVTNGLHGIEGAQLVRPKGENRNEKHKDSRPNRYLIDLCTAAETAADYVILVWRKQKGTTTKVGDRMVPLDVEDAEIIVDKSKDGPTGVIQVGWCTTRNRFEYRQTDAVQTNMADRAPPPPPTQAQEYDDDF